MLEENKWVADYIVEYYDLLGNIPHTNVMVVGGAARDLLLDKPVKDIDFSVSCGMHATGEVLVALSKAGFIRDHHSSYANEFAVFSASGGKVQAIVNRERDSLSFIHKTFDIGLCMVALDNEGRFITSKQFRNDRDNGWLTLYMRDSLTRNQAGRAVQEHLPRLMKKYPLNVPIIQYPINMNMDWWADR